MNWQSIVHTAGPQADKIAALWWFFVGLLGIIFVLVMGVAIATLLRRPGEKPDPTRAVAVSSVLTVILLFVLIVMSVSTGKATADLGKQANPLIIDVTGNQWWWEFRYRSNDPSQTLITANEIHIPVGRPVLIQGQSNDVIHSFWIPSLNGKRDLIPSRVTSEYIQVDKAGVYRGQCAEFCGLQHAHMSFFVVAEPADAFERWKAAQLRPAAEPVDELLKRGQAAFLNYECVYCHQIRGTEASAQNGPDLTHFGSRQSIAAGTLPNNKGNLGGWLVNPQKLKPGNHMATIAIEPKDMQPLLEYLESLK